MRVLLIQYKQVNQKNLLFIQSYDVEDSAWALAKTVEILALGLSQADINFFRGVNCKIRKIWQSPKFSYLKNNGGATLGLRTKFTISSDI